MNFMQWTKPQVLLLNRYCLLSSAKYAKMYLSDKQVYRVRYIYLLPNAHSKMCISVYKVGTSFVLPLI